MPCASGSTRASGNRRGFGRFARNAVAALVELDPTTDYVLYVDRGDRGRSSCPPGASVRSCRSRAPRRTLRQRRLEPAARDLLRFARAVRARRARTRSSSRRSTPSSRSSGRRRVVGLHDTIPERAAASSSLAGRRARPALAAEASGSPSAARRGSSRSRAASRAALAKRARHAARAARGGARGARPGLRAASTRGRSRARCAAPGSRRKSRSSSTPAGSARTRTSRR